MPDAPHDFMLAWLIMFSLGGVLGDSEVPTVCQPTESRLDTRQRLAVTMCAARVRIAALTHLRDTDVSTLAVEVAAAPSFAVLDEVVSSDVPLWQVVALDLRGDLYVSMAVRMRHANASNWRVTPWLARARRAYSDARSVAMMHPEVFEDDAVPRALAMIGVGLGGATGPAEETNR
jgi:hypothetical protein